MYINSISYFRAIAIIIIVFGHCLSIADFNYSSILGNTIFNLTIGGTSLFVFISGFLFHHIFYSKFEYKPFIIKKIRFVLYPYLILSTIPIAYILLKICIRSVLSSGPFLFQYEALSSFPIFSHYLTGIGISYITGAPTSYIGYWYIPFIMIVFAISPIFVRFIKLKLRSQILIAIFLLISSIFMHRGTGNDVVSVFQNIIYFIPVYLIGIISSEKRGLIYSTFKGKELYVFLIFIILALVQVFSGKLGNYHKDPFTFAGIDLMLIQKIIFCLFLVVYLNRFENYKLRFLEIIATNSFGIYFIHGIVIWAITILKSKFDFSFTSNSFITYFLVAILVFFLSLMATLIIKRTFPKHSRYLVGC